MFAMRMREIKNGNGWEQRAPVQIDLINFYSFDVLGTQEMYGQLNDLLLGLPDYNYVGVGRDDGKTKEFAPIFYKEERIQHLDSGHFWLSEESAYPNKGWDAVLPRICTWAHFKDRKRRRNFGFSIFIWIMWELLQGVKVQISS